MNTVYNFTCWHIVLLILPPGRYLDHFTPAGTVATLVGFNGSFFRDLEAFSVKDWATGNQECDPSEANLSEPVNLADVCSLI